LDGAKVGKEKKEEGEEEEKRGEGEL